MADTEEVNDFLAHYGVLGMKWGHHKAQRDKAAARVYEARRVARGHGDKMNKALKSKAPDRYEKAGRHEDRALKNQGLVASSATRKEHAAKVLIGAAAASFALNGIGHLAMNSKNTKVATGAHIIRNLSGLAFWGTAIGAVATANSASKDEKKYNTNR